MDINKAKKVVEDHKNEQIRKCKEEVFSVLKKYNCGLMVSPNILIQGRPPEIAIVFKGMENGCE
jgi:hypothetical protein